MENYKHRFDDLKNDKITEKGREIWRRKLKNVENLEMSTVGPGIWREN
ncbi:hypothetical protein T4B_10473 [Trichinella pseudospiralis]|uniref:Uncharacterized protein n=1 Tax=Trichinella pseudospiralis TaxID=6337 RepID=A0A0V1G920_TRIPS|nr:hypothetical protein T4B_10473 [Trichinella pseudospiralis]